MTIFDTNMTKSCFTYDHKEFYTRLYIAANIESWIEKVTLNRYSFSNPIIFIKEFNIIMKKRLKDKITLSPNENAINTENNINLEYYILESETEESNVFFGIRYYGVEIVKKHNQLEIEKNSIYNVCCNENNAHNLLNRLIVNKVTPIELPFVLDNILGE
jgi:hypothetical protein